MRPDTPLVSVVIPTFNRAWGLAVAVKSVLAQSFRDFEIVIVDDCSQDDTPQVARSFEDDRIRCFRQPRNVGVAENWGRGLALAAGDLVAFLMDDDRYDPRFLERRVAALQACPESIVAFSGYAICDDRGGRLGEAGPPWPGERELSPRELLRAALRKDWFIGASLYRKSAVRQVWDRAAADHLVLDFTLNIELSAGGWGPGVYLPHRDFVMMRHSGQISQSRQEQVFEQASSVLQRLLARPVPPDCARLVRQELAAWQVLHGRALAAQGRLGEARACLWQAVRACPSAALAWRQIGQAWLWPHRLAESARRQRAPAASGMAPREGLSR